MVTVVALQDFVYQDAVVYQGQAVEMAPIDAAVHGRLRHVSLDPGARPTYQRRDMVAASPVQPVQLVVGPVQPVPDPVPAPRRRRGGRRRKAVA